MPPTRAALLAVLLLALFTADALAESGPPEVVYPKLPDQAATAEAFVPAGWAVENRLGGDLNGDGIADVVLLLRDRDPANIIKDGDDSLDTNPRILAVLFGQPGGGYALAAANHTLIPRLTEPGIEDYLDNPRAIEIVRGSLRIGLRLFMSAGSWTTSNYTFVLRHRNGAFALIGYDSYSIHRASHDGEAASIDYLTGWEKLSTWIGDNAPKVRRKTLPRHKPLTLDEIGDGIDFVPPFGSRDPG